MQAPAMAAQPTGGAGAARGNPSGVQPETTEDARALVPLRDLEVRRAYEALSREGYFAIFVDIYNGGSVTLGDVQFAIEYLRDGRLVAADPGCGGAVEIPPGETGRLGCYKREIAGSTSWRIRLERARAR